MTQEGRIPSNKKKTLEEGFPYFSMNSQIKAILMRIKRIESKMNMMSTKVWSWDLLSSDQSWKRMSMDIQTSSEMRFSVRNQ